MALLYGIESVRRENGRLPVVPEVASLGGREAHYLPGGRPEVCGANERLAVRRSS
jgi:hypothetical protein